MPHLGQVEHMLSMFLASTRTELTNRKNNFKAIKLSGHVSKTLNNMT
jgi:hypothetical protein